MALSAQDVFTMQLARAAATKANKFLAVRRLQKSDRDDITAAALLWCWENRGKYDALTHDLDMWFLRAVRNAWESWRANELPPSDESIENLTGGDDTYNTVAAESASNALLSALTPISKEIAILTMQGYSRREMMSRGYSKQSVDDAHKRIKQLRRLMPDKELRTAIRTEPAPGSDDADDTLAPIDFQLGKLEFAPPGGKQCPPCWRCLWFYGFTPSGKRSTRLDIEDSEVREAVKNTEARKVEIAQWVRDGII